MIINLIIYILLCLYGIVFSILYSVYPAFVMVGTLMVFPLVSWVICIIASFFLKVEIKPEEETMHKEESMRYTITIRNNGIIPIGNGRIRLNYGLIHSKKREKQWLKFSVSGREEVNIHVNIKCDYCGYLSVKSSRIQVYDYFKIFHLTKFSKVEEKILVYPKVKIYPLSVNKVVLYGNEEEDGFEQNQPGDDPSQVFDFREYREGDKLQRIHWKLSSKKDKLMVKEFSKPIVINSAVLVDLYSDKANDLEYYCNLLERAISVSYSLLSMGVKHYVFWVNYENDELQKHFIDSEEGLYFVVGSLALGLAKASKNDLVSEYIALGNVYSNLYYVGSESQEELEQLGLKAEVI